MIDTKGLGAGSYPDAPEFEEKTVTLHCSFTTYISVPKDWDYEKVEDYVKTLGTYDLTEEADSIEVEDIENVY
jgi:hypothetical protein